MSPPARSHVHIRSLDNSRGVDARVKKESLVLGRKDGIDKYFGNLLEMDEAAPLALLAGEIVHELRLEAIPARLFIPVNQDECRYARRGRKRGRFGAEERLWARVDLDLVAIDAVVPGRICDRFRITALSQLSCNLSWIDVFPGGKRVGSGVDAHRVSERP